MSVLCGNCKERHDTVGDVRACYGLSRSATNLEQIAAHGRSQTQPYDQERKTAEADQRRRAPTPPEKLLRKAFARLRSPYRLDAEVQRCGYVVDLYCEAAKLAIEVDGRVHRGQTERDKRRDDYLRANGIEVERITATSIFRDADAAAKLVLSELKKRPTSHSWNSPPTKKESKAAKDEARTEQLRREIELEDELRQAEEAAEHNKVVMASPKKRTFGFTCTRCGHTFRAASSPKPKCNRCKTSEAIMPSCLKCDRVMDAVAPRCVPCFEARQVATSHNAHSDWQRSGRHSGGT